MIRNLLHESVRRIAVGIGSGILLVACGSVPEVAPSTVSSPPPLAPISGLTAEKLQLLAMRVFVDPVAVKGVVRGFPDIRFSSASEAQNESRALVTFSMVSEQDSAVFYVMCFDPDPQLTMTAVFDYCLDLPITDVDPGVVRAWWQTLDPAVETAEFIYEGVSWETHLIGSGTDFDRVLSVTAADAGVPDSPLPSAPTVTGSNS